MLSNRLAGAGIRHGSRLGLFRPIMSQLRVWAVILFLLGLWMNLGAQKLVLERHQEWRRAQRHPHTDLLREPVERSDMLRRSGGAVYRRVLVILVDFQEEVVDDPLTTGNGKFLMEPDPSWATSIGSPPHDRAFFEANMEALRYYYLAVSYGSFDLEYDVWPKSQAAYTLPHTMGYYNPPNATADVFVAKMEEYFRTAFETADAVDPEIDFSSYGHFIIIHAGSDWQHDVLSNTPSDLPSFFIRVGSGKEAVVDDGSFLISTACNIPSMIRQDIRSYTDNGITYNAGYGTINSVLAHEFGHSLGLVDLYNVFNFQPMVGVFDIMDSGGNGQMVDGPGDDGSYTLIEGILPVLPGAWSRKLLFEEFYRQSGLLKNVDQIPLYLDIKLSAATHRQNPANITAMMLKIPLNEQEYILVENRNVDPDGDGGTAVYGSLDGRVILHPTGLFDETNQPTYEYDYLLPSFVDARGNAIGGGVLVWHIDNDIMHNQGVTDSEGNFRSHFESNTVNVRYNHRGVKIIEADDLPDIGNIYSWYWTGTPFEYFHRNKPTLNVNGDFVNWSNQIWRPALGAETIPQLVDNAGRTGFYGLSNIGHPAALMNLRVNGGFFENAQVISFGDDSVIAAPLINSSFSNSAELAVIGSSNINLHTYDQNNTWVNQMGAFDMEPLQVQYPLTKADTNNNGYYELVAVDGNRLRFLEFAQDDLSDWSVFSGSVSGAPLFHQGYLYYFSDSHLYRYNSVSHDSISVSQAGSIGAIGDNLYVIAANHVHTIALATFGIAGSYPLPEQSGVYDPVILDTGDNQVVFFFANDGNLYRLDYAGIDKIFSNMKLPAKPTQLGLFQHDDRTPALIFGIGDRIYAISPDGTLLPGYPQNIHPRKAEAYSNMFIFTQNDAPYVMMPVIGGYLGVNTQGGISARHSVMGTQPSGDTFLVWQSNPGTLFWYYCDGEANLNIFSKAETNGDPIVWNGYRNQGTGVFSGFYQADDPPVDSSISALIFPNPVRSGIFRVRLENAQAAVQVRIYDIAGKLIHEQHFAPYPSNVRDLQIEMGRLSVGVYIAVVEHQGKSARIRFARE